MTGKWGRKPDKELTNNKTLENKGKNQQIEIDEKSPNLLETEEKNRSASGAGYYVFAFLFRVLVVASRRTFVWYYGTEPLEAEPSLRVQRWWEERLL